MSYQHKSGAQKCKERQKKLELSAKKSRTLFEVGLELKGKPSIETTTDTANISVTNINCDTSTLAETDKDVTGIGAAASSHEDPTSLKTTTDTANISVTNINCDTSTLAETDKDVTGIGAAASSHEDPTSLKTEDEAILDTAIPNVIIEDSEGKTVDVDVGDSSEPVNLRMRDIDLPTPAQINESSSLSVISSDLGQFNDINFLSSKAIESLVKIEPSPFPKELPADGKRAFPRSVLVSKLANDETVPRDWLSWSDITQSIHCFPCRLFGCVDTPDSQKSVLLTGGGWKKEYSWRKLYNKLPDHENSTNHKRCYIKWREIERRLLNNSDIASRLDEELFKKTEHWKELLRRIVSVVLFLAERGLPFIYRFTNLQQQ